MIDMRIVLEQHMLSQMPLAPGVALRSRPVQLHDKQATSGTNPPDKSVEQETQPENGPPVDNRSSWIDRQGDRPGALDWHRHHSMHPGIHCGAACRVSPTLPPDGPYAPAHRTVLVVSNSLSEMQAQTHMQHVVTSITQAQLRSCRRLQRAAALCAAVSQTLAQVGLRADLVARVVTRVLERQAKGPRRGTAGDPAEADRRLSRRTAEPYAGN